jgi:DNA-binding Xre family transcriptional regulator
LILATSFPRRPYLFVRFYKKIHHRLRQAAVSYPYTKRVKKTDLKKLAGLSTSAVAKFAKGEPVSLEIIEKLCGAPDCQPEDIFEIVKDGDRRRIAR